MDCGKESDRLGKCDTEPSPTKTQASVKSLIAYDRRGALQGITMMEAMYEADEARQLEENRARLLSYVDESEEPEKESRREADDCLGTHDSVPG